MSDMKDCFIAIETSVYVSSLRHNVQPGTNSHRKQKYRPTKTNHRDIQC